MSDKNISRSRNYLQENYRRHWKSMEILSNVCRCKSWVTLASVDTTASLYIAVVMFRKKLLTGSKTWKKLDFWIWVSDSKIVDLFFFLFLSYYLSFSYFSISIPLNSSIIFGLNKRGNRMSQLQHHITYKVYVDYVLEVYIK